ncbi:MAG: DUF547 domain-containing protein [Bdellovibrionales bacterium]
MWFFAGLLALSVHAAPQSFDHEYKAWSALLGEYQNAEGLVAYKKLKSSGDLAPILSTLESVSYAQYNKWSDNQKKAFLINSYNAFTVKLILDHYPVASIKKIGSWFKKPWSIKFFKLLDGKIQSLDPIEHEWLRPKYKDYRIHAAVNCASKSCPPLRHEAFVGSKLDAQLDEQMKLWLADESRNNLSDKKKIKISKIFDWYKSDFESWGGGILKVIEKHSGQSLSEPKITFLEYDWSLNDQG